MSELTVNLNQASSRLQAEISSSPFNEWVLSDGKIWTLFFRNGRDYLLRFPGLVDFTVSADGRTVSSFAVPGIQQSTVQHIYLNQVLPLAISTQGKLVFHASSVEINKSAIAFMGVSGRGKSTLAASFACSGSRFLTDDALLLEKSNGIYRVQPSHPSIRLWDDSRQALMSDAGMLAAPVEYTNKARIVFNDEISFCDESRSLRHVYFLGDGCKSKVQISPLKPCEALMGLVNHSFLLDIEARDIVATHFDEMTQLVESPIYYRLDYSRDFEDLPSVREAIIRHSREDKS